MLPLSKGKKKKRGLETLLFCGSLFGGGKEKEPYLAAKVVDFYDSGKKRFL